MSNLLERTEIELRSNSIPFFANTRLVRKTMALDFHRLDNKEYLFGLDDKKYKNLDEIFTEYKNWTGVYIDPYGDTKLTIENQKMFIKIIDTYI